MCRAQFQICIVALWNPSETSYPDYWNRDQGRDLKYDDKKQTKLKIRRHHTKTESQWRNIQFKFEYKTIRDTYKYVTRKINIKYAYSSDQTHWTSNSQRKYAKRHKDSGTKEKQSRSWTKSASLRGFTCKIKWRENSNGFFQKALGSYHPAFKQKWNVQKRSDRTVSDHRGSMQIRILNHMLQVHATGSHSWMCCKSAFLALGQLCFKWPKAPHPWQEPMTWHQHADSLTGCSALPTSCQPIK